MRLFLALTLIFLPFQIEARSWEARGAGANFKLVINQDKLTYHGPLKKTVISRLPCNKILIQKFEADLIESFSKSPMSEKSDLKLMLDKKLHKIDLNSQLAPMLISMEDSMRSLEVAERIVCGR